MPPARNEPDEDSNSEVHRETPKSSCTTYVAEGDKLFRKNEFRKAIDSYTQALNQAEAEEVDKKQSFISRALCHLNMGDSEAALSDAEEALELEPSYTKGLWIKAEALYAMGDFEYALLFYHRGYQARSDFREFRIGIQKSQEAIENAIGKDDNQDLSSEGDLAMFYNRDLTQNYITFSEKRAKTKKGGTQKKEEKKKDESKTKEKVSKKSSRRLLGQLYADKEFLQDLLQDETITNPETDSGKKIQEYTSDALQYLGKREDFWRQQNPSRLHSKKQERTSSGRVITSANLRKNDPEKYIYRQLERIEDDLEKKKYKQAEKRGRDVLDEAKGYPESDLPNKQDFLATIYSLVGTATLEQGKYEQAEKNFLKDFEISDETNNFDGSSRALDNLGRVSVKLEKFDKAIQYWESKLQLLQQQRTSTSGSAGGERSKTAKDTALEKTWLYHEIGRSHLELKNNSEAKEYGERALASAKQAEDEVWQLNALVLTGKAEAQMEEYQAASESFEKALELAKDTGAKNAQKAIESALRDVNNKIVRGVKNEETGEDERSARESKTDEREETKQTAPPQQEKAAPTKAAETRASSENEEKQEDASESEQESKNDTKDSTEKDGDATGTDVEQAKK